MNFQVRLFNDEKMNTQETGNSGFALESGRATALGKQNTAKHRMLITRASPSRFWRSL